MVYKYYFFILFVVVDICVFVLMQNINVNLLQLENYSVKKFIKNIVKNISKFYIYFLVFFCLCLIVVILDFFDIIFLAILLILYSTFIIYMLTKNSSSRSFVFTKRVFRILLLSILIEGLKCFLCIWLLPIKIMAILYPFSLVINVISLVFVMFMLYPIERLIGWYYIEKAKKKIRQNKTLVKIGITGSYGKTSVKEILTSVLKEMFSVVCTPESYNTPFGISKTINNMLSNTTEIFVCEMGAKHVGEINELCEIVGVDFGIVTSVGRQHTETFGSIENVYRTKKELADNLYNKTCVFNLMNVYTHKMYDEFVGCKIGIFVINKSKMKTSACIKKVVTSFNVMKHNCYYRFFAFPKKNNYYAKIRKLTTNGSVFDVYFGDAFIGVFETKLLGEHNIINILLCIALSRVMGVEIYKIQSAVKLLKPIKARLEKFTTSNGAIVINNGYNSNINSVSSSLRVLQLFKDKIKVIVTPGLIETDDDEAYNIKFGEVVGKVADEIIIVKQKNRNAIISGLKNVCFDMSKIYTVDSFFEAKKVIDLMGSNYVFLIENDLPDNYR